MCVWVVGGVMLENHCKLLSPSLNAQAENETLFKRLGFTRDYRVPASNSAIKIKQLVLQLRRI